MLKTSLTKLKLKILTDFIFVIDDNLDFLESLVLLLEENHFEVKSAQSGRKALQVLNKISQIPDLIISDIKMPIMNGYKLFAEISKNPRLNEIPFIFLSALSDNKEIRIGKRLGIDDYLTKPVKEELLLAAIKGKLNRKKIIGKINHKIAANLAKFDLPEHALVSDNRKEEIWILEFIWDDTLGPTLVKYHPMKSKSKDLISKLGLQCFSAITAIYGPFKSIKEPQDLLITLENVNKRAYLLFDSLSDQSTRTNKKAFMLGVIASEITYFESLEIKQLLKNLSIKIKLDKPHDLKVIWEDVIGILTKPVQ
ncbi:MAG: response regulator [Candidatus Lokiarchaeota archaeon]|nr:response regulator [Candidatus Lokiarchaeota archaeon]MBD3199196.1 response regulator [Candidatus Lokiarchaeota archaeon]